MVPGVRGSHVDRQQQAGRTSKHSCSISVCLASASASCCCMAASSAARCTCPSLERLPCFAGAAPCVARSSSLDSCRVCASFSGLVRGLPSATSPVLVLLCGTTGLRGVELLSLFGFAFMPSLKMLGFRIAVQRCCTTQQALTP